MRKTVSAVYDIATRNDYDVLMTMVGEQETSPMQRLLVNRKIDGVILARTLERDPLIPMLQKSGIPFVAIGRPADQDVISVDHDQVGGCRELVSLLLMKGLHRIALLGGSMLYTVNQSRLEGYKQAHDRACCKIDESLLFLELESDDLRTSAVELAVQRGADCILCMDDQVALLALSTLRQLNLRVPQDIRLASMYDDEALQECTPQITAVSLMPNSWAAVPHSSCFPSSATSRWKPAPCWGTRWGCAYRPRPERKVENYKSTARTRYDKPLCGQFFDKGF